eukprot:UN13123
MKNMNSQNDVNSLLEVVKGSETVQKASIFCEEFDERTFKYEFLLITSPERTVQNSKNIKNLIVSKF